MKYRLSKIVMHNFKLFSHAIIDLKEQALTVLDGPNGYGKTSTFDAIEYMITGTVERVENSSNVVGTVSYQEDCMMKIPSDGTGTYVEGYFICEDKELMIRRHLEKGNGRENNPRNISMRTKTDIELNGEQIIEGAEVGVANVKVAELLGEQIIPFYNRYFYISQEDRLAFLKKNDTDRMKEIQKQFGIEREEAMLKKLQSIRKKFKDIGETLETDISAKNEEIKQTAIPEESGEKSKKIEYKKLLEDDNNIIWDRKLPQIVNVEKLSVMQREVEAVGAFSRDFTTFCKKRENIWANQYRQNKEELKRLLFMHSYEEIPEDFFQQMEEYQTIKRIVKPLEEKTPLYEKLSYEKLAGILEIDADLTQISEVLKQIKEYQGKLKQEEFIRNELLRLRVELEAARNKWIEAKIQEIDESKCPFCGHPWDNREQLEKSIKALTLVLENNKGDTQKQLDKEVNKLKQIYFEQYEERVENFLDKYAYLDSEVCQSIYEAGEIFNVNYRRFSRECEKYQIDLDDWAIDVNAVDDVDEAINNFIENCLEKHITKIEEEYNERELDYHYETIFKRIYNDKDEKVKELSETDIKEKIAYLEQQFYLQQEDIKNKLKEELEKYVEREKYVEKIYLKLGEMVNTTKNKLNEYKKDVVRDLRLPFYLYTGRILQNYPGGLGVKLKIYGEDKIGFKASERNEHDIFYTFSSGQLSAVAISLTLTLNKVYAKENFNCIMIDDPIQTMDELNISSFVELMRNDFANSQFVISTHEDDFSDYIRYKYQKYHLSNGYVTVRNIEN